MSLSKDGIDNISLQFSRTPARYRAGEDLMGRIIVICNDTTPVKGKVIYTKYSKQFK